MARFVLRTAKLDETLEWSVESKEEATRVALARMLQGYNTHDEPISRVGTGIWNKQGWKVEDVWPMLDALVNKLLSPEYADND